MIFSLKSVTIPLFINERESNCSLARQVDNCALHAQ